MRKWKWIFMSAVLVGGPSYVQAQAPVTAPFGEVYDGYGQASGGAYAQQVAYDDGAAATCDSCGGGGCDSCTSGCDDCCLGDWRDNTEILLGGDSYASLGDFPSGGYNNSFGMMAGFNTGFALGQSNVRAQAGMNYGVYDFEGRGFPGAGAENSSWEQQIYLTGGFSKRSDVSNGDYVSWGLVYDYFLADNWGANSNELDMGQVRGLVGYALNECNEVGVWGTLNALSDQATISTRGNVTLRAMNQANLFWRHNYDFGGSTMLYVGAMDNADVGDWQFGFTGRAPLSDYCSLYGNFNYVVPSTRAGVLGDQEDQWNVGFGLVWFLGGKSVSPDVSGNQGLPLMNVANNGSFLITD